MAASLWIIEYSLFEVKCNTQDALVVSQTGTNLQKSRSYSKLESVTFHTLLVPTVEGDN